MFQKKERRMIMMEMIRAMRELWLMLLDDADWRRRGRYLKRYDLN
jgi:hypothetical protein